MAMTVVPNVSLRYYNTLAFDTKARFFVSVEDEFPLEEAIHFARQRQLPILVVGGGSNLVLKNDFDGLVVHMHILGRDVVEENDEWIYLKVGAGENWHDLVSYCMQFHIWGLENLALIPGTAGAAPIQNIGAYGVELADVFYELRAYDIHSALPVTFDLPACRFGYRDSIFKQALKDQYVITSITLRLPTEPKANVAYKALADALAFYEPEEITPQIVFNKVCEIRRTKLPDPQLSPNVGSFFKNPVVSELEFKRLQSRFPDVVAYPQDNGDVKLAAGWLIDHLGWKGRRRGKAKVYPLQALVLVNEGDPNADNLLALANDINESVAETFGVQLEIEPRIF